MKRRIAISLLFAVLLSLTIVPVSAEYAFPHSTLLEEEIIPYEDGSDYYIEINDNIPEFAVWQRTAFPFVLFSDLDELGRTGPAYACLGPETLPTDVRGQIGSVYPSGWQNTRYDDLIDGGYLYNRSHLIGYLLCGDSGTKENLFTGTRLLNATTMLLIETAVEMYIEETGNHVLYRVTPFYHGEDLVPFGVQIEAQSMETDLDGFCCNVFLYNIQPGIEIDYSTGVSWRENDFFPMDINPAASGDVVRAVPAETPTPSPEPASEPTSITYVLNKSTHRFHFPDCSSVMDIKPKNREDVDWSRAKVIDKGYKPCGNCHP